MRRLKSSDASFSAAWLQVCDRGLDAASDTERAVADIISAVRKRGDAAITEYTERFDKRSPGPQGYEISAEDWSSAAAQVSSRVAEALEVAAARIRSFHEPQKSTGYEQADGRLALRVTPLSTVGIYVPGGTALYPSSVLMTAIPAKIAGVEEIIMVTPGASKETLAAARIAGVDRVFEIGGAQAIAGLAFGTTSIPRVDKIVGPGNQWVAAAKRQVFGQVDIDSVAGPSEVLVIADSAAPASMIAADLLAQAEHDTQARVILLSDSEAALDAIIAEVNKQLPKLSRHKIAEASVREFGVAVLVSTIDEAIELANTYAPEHQELAVEDAARYVPAVRTAGAIFVGHYTPEAAGDYSAGPNHVLPTGGAARYASPLGVYDFVKHTTVLAMSRDDLSELSDSICAIAEVEGLDAHARSVRVRFEQEDSDG